MLHYIQVTKSPIYQVPQPLAARKLIYEFIYV